VPCVPSRTTNALRAPSSNNTENARHLRPTRASRNTLAGDIPTTVQRRPAIDFPAWRTWHFSFVSYFTRFIRCSYRLELSGPVSRQVRWTITFSAVGWTTQRVVPSSGHSSIVCDCDALGVSRSFRFMWKCSPDRKTILKWIENLKATGSTMPRWPKLDVPRPGRHLETSPHSIEHRQSSLHRVLLGNMPPLFFGRRIERWGEFCTVTFNYTHTRVRLLRNCVKQTGRNVQIAILQDMSPDRAWSHYGKTLHGHLAPQIWAAATFSDGGASKLRSAKHRPRTLEELKETGRSWTNCRNS